jgi:CRISPR/Cas system CSM-associated protein Csm3 (group 7 of RAMP superfamily)
MMMAMTPVIPANINAAQGCDTPEGPPVWQPFVPGSGIRGPLRHQLSHRRRAEGERVTDPVSGSDYRPATLEEGAVGASHGDDVAKASSRSKPTRYSITELFGAMPAKGSEPETSSARLLVRDAFLDNQSAADWRYAILQLHAEDEFTAGVFGNSKFDRLALLHGVFNFEMVIEARPGEEDCALAAAQEIRAEMERFASHGIALGGAQWRGHGWIEWTELRVEQGRAGDKPIKSAQSIPDPATEEQTT